MEARSVNVLLVDDDEVDVMTVRRTFERNDISHFLYVANSGSEALDMLRGTAPDLPTVPAHRRIVLLDINMPCMSGLEFLQELRQDETLCNTPVIVLTTSNDDHDREEAYRLNVAGYLIKPIKVKNFDEIMLALNQYWAYCEIP
ncbi:MAG: response regulator [Leptolyngbyaceae cyanobacterium SM2_3_12]|nr:response regulator [Leptolyngbyaceae cyanobacterium SM2_3_12]